MAGRLSVVAALLMAAAAMPVPALAQSGMGLIVVNLDVVPDSAQDFEFTYTGNPNVFILDDDADPTRSNQITPPVAPGRYTVRQNKPSGWTISGIDCSAPATVDLAAGTATFDVADQQQVVCTFTNVATPGTGTIELIVDALPDAAQDFAFVATGRPEAFLLDDDADPVLADRVAFPVPPGNYAVTEVVPPGWELASIACTGAADIDLAANRASFTVADQQTVRCTFTNAAMAIRPSPGPTTPARSGVGLHDPATGNWYLRNSAGQVARIVYGNPHDQPFMGDWDCDGVDTPGLYRPLDTPAGPAGRVYLRNSNTTGTADVDYLFGNPGDFAVAGDWDGDGCDTVSLFRPATATMYISNHLGASNMGLGAADSSFPFGAATSRPFGGDFDADPQDELGYVVAGPESAGRNVVLILTLAGDGRELGFGFGNPGDVGLAGDWDGDGVDTIGLYRSSDTFGPAAATFYLRNANTPGRTDILVLPFGDRDWTPLAGRFGLD